MADTAISTGELPTQRREHLPRQQPHQPLRHHVLTASAADSETRSGIRPMSLGGESRGRDHVQYPSMGPHPGATPISRVNSIGAGARMDDGHDHTRLQAKASYLQQRATGTLGEHVFNAHDPATAPTTRLAPPATDQQQQQEVGPPAAQQPHKASSSGSSRRMVGPYQLAKTIGAGSMGKVKVALDTRTNKRVAAKIIPLQQPDAPIYFPSRLDTTSSRTAHASAREATPAFPVPDGPIDASVEPWRTWLMGLALESQPDLAAAVKYPVHVQRKLRLLQPRERYTTKDREQRENKDIRIVREVAINRLLHHPHICMLHDVVVHPNHYYIFQELVSGGQMLDYIISHGRLKEKHARKFARQIASAIDYCHHNSIVHRDLKIENILISANGNIKLIDFGLSNLYSPRSQLSTFCGSLYFAAPELLNAQPYTGPEVDLWSFGVVLYVLVCGKVPFDDQSMPALHAKIKRGHVEYPSWLSPECKHLLSRLLVVAHQRRATMGEIVRHPWMCKGYVESPMVNNYLPVRVPLVSPEQIDRNVVHEMAQYIGFGFGSEDEIRIGLEAILTEDWYRTWLKDALAPQLETVKLRLREQVLHHKPATTSALALAQQEVRDTAAATDPTLREAPPPLTLQHAGSSSGATLTNPADAPNHSLLPSRERQGHNSLATNTSIAPGHTEASGAPDSLSGDSVRKRSSFWKRSSTFISGGLARAGHKPISETHSSGLPGHASHAATEKTQPGQFRVLSSRIFNDSKHGSPSADSNASREYSASPLSPHSPRMYVDPASGMVSIWKDGKLAPLDTDCAAIQQAYHDLVATDPLLSIYYLVKERREREAGASARHHTTILLSQYQSSAIPSTHATIDPTTSSAVAASASAVGSKHGRQDSSETWVKLERAPDPAASANNKPRPVAKEAGARQPSASKVPSSVDRGRDHAATLQIAHAGGTSNPTDTTHDMPIDQTTAAIEALSLHPRARGATQPSVPGASGTPQTAGFQDPRKKRSSIFKRFSVIVKGARPSQKHPSTPLDNTSYIVQAEGGESGYMEISLDGRGGNGVGDHLQQDNPIVANGAVSAPSTQLPANAEPIGERLRSNVGGQRYSALDSIDEDREYVRVEDAPGASASRTPANAASTIPLSEHEPQNIAPASQSLDAVGRQYLVKSLTPGQSPGCTAAEAPPARGIDAAASGSSMPSIAPTSHPIGSNGAAGTDGAYDSAVARTSDYERPQPSGCSAASRSSGDLCGASSMFTNSELDENENTARNQLASRDGTAGRGELGSPLSEKAALLDKARREIEGFDEHEGVGLLDQTPELNYRVAGQVQGSSFDAMKRRTRSSSNTVVRVLSEIVRDGSGGSSNNNNNASSRGSKRAAKPSGGPRQRGPKGASSPPNTSTSGQSLPAKTIPRHNSTGAINSASGSGYFEESVLGSSAQHVLQTAEAKSHASSANTGFPRPDILRSQSHASASRPQGFVLPERIAEVSEPPTPREPWPENALKVDAEKDSERVMRTGPDKRARSGNPAGSALVEFKLSPDVEPPTTGDTADSDDMHDVTSAPPRADEYLKPVFLKGLFSVSTTSTRSPSAIRANLLGVLSEMPLRFHEGRGYFTCSMATTAGPSNLQEEALDAFAQDDMTTSLSSGLHKPRRSLRLPGVDRKISFRRRVKHSEKAPSTQPHTHDGVSSNDDNLSGSRQSIADLSSDDAKDHSRPAAPLPVQAVLKSANNNAICFQIFLVRMPLLGLCGLQFRRVSGPTWKYKDLCSEILKRLKL
ncbi:Serine/threonine-protein kinase [Coemansia aciculifera]|nr:Serine/threonine-protein kinase [Coemansia aciculifera]